jgi:hypothetical protein
MLILAYAVIYAWTLVSSCLCLSRVKGFLNTTSTIADEQSLERFKALARFNMRMALVQILVFLAGIITSIAIILRYGFLGLAGVMAVNGVLLVLGLYMWGLEKRARSLPAATEELAQQHRRISETWVKKALPDF